MKGSISPQRRKERRGRAERELRQSSASALLRSLRLCAAFVLSCTQLRFALVALAFSVTFSSCGSQSSTQQLKDEMRTQKSWAATLRMIGESWLSGAVPATYTRKALENVAQAIGKERKTISESSTLPVEQRTELVNRAQSLEETASQMRQATEQGDRTAFQQQMERVKRDEEAIGKSLAENPGEPAP